MYITDGVLDNRENVSTLINLSITISLQNENQAYISEILLLVVNESLDKDGNNFTVERGYLNTEIKVMKLVFRAKAVKS